MSDLRISIAVPVPAGGALDTSVFPNVARAVLLLAESGVTIWQEYASGAALPNGKSIESRSGAYMRSIHRRAISDFSQEVLSEIPYANIIENGAPPRDMKDMLNTSMKVRIAKDGSRYLIIPFRHGTPGTVTFRSVMSDAVYGLARAMAASRVTGMGSRRSGTGAYDIKTRRAIRVPQREYKKWGDRLTSKELSAAGVHGRARRHMAGMVKMQNPGAAGGSKHTQYMTFRVMSEKSTGWLVPAREGYAPAAATAEKLRAAAPRLFEEAIKSDLSAYLGQ